MAQSVVRVIALIFHDRALVGGERSAARPGRNLPPRERTGTHCRGGLVGTTPVWTGVENHVPTWNSIPDRPARSSVAIPTELPDPIHEQSKNVNE